MIASRRLASWAVVVVMILAAATPAAAGEKTPIVSGGKVAAPVPALPAPAAPAPTAPRWGLPAELPVDGEARDPVFAVLIALAEQDLFGVLTQDRLRAEVARSGRPTKLPLERLGAIRRAPLARLGGARVSMTGLGPVDIPVPYEVLGYHPGRFRASPRSEFEEWRLGTVALDVGRWQEGGGSEIALFHDVRIWGLVAGSVEMDVDGWLDALLGSKLDDTRVVGLALFRYQGELYGLATGYSKSGRGRSGAFSFREDKLVFPSPPAFKAIGSYVRGRLEREIPALARTRRG